MWDVDFQTAVAQAEIEDREVGGPVPPHRVRPRRRRGRGRDRDLATRADPRVRRARRATRRRAVRDAGRARPSLHAAVPRAGAGRRPRARRSREGDRHRDDLHVRRRHRRHLVARARAARAGRGRPRRHDRAGPVRRARLGVATIPRRANAAMAELAGKGDEAGAQARSPSCCARRGALLGEPKPVRHAGEVLRERRTTARGHHEPPVVRPDARAPATSCSRAAQSSAGIPRSWARATRRGSRG